MSLETCVPDECSSHFFRDNLKPEPPIRYTDRNNDAGCCKTAKNEKMISIYFVFENIDWLQSFHQNQNILEGCDDVNQSHYVRRGWQFYCGEGRLAISDKR